MNMKAHINSCKRRAKQLRQSKPNLPYCKRLDIAAKEQGFKHYTSITNLYKLLGENTSPSHLAIAIAGGNASDSPYKMISKSITLS